MGYWKVLERLAAPNYIQNPSFEYNVTDGWSLVAGTRAQAETGYRGAHNCALTAGGAGVDAILESNVVSIINGASVTVSAWIYRAAENTGFIEVWDHTNAAQRAHVHFTPTQLLYWEHLECTWTNDHGHAVDVCLRIQNTMRDGAAVVAIDCCQMETGVVVASTYIDGDQEGCWWQGIPHYSYSQRSGQSQAGGTIRDLESVYSFYVEQMAGVGDAPAELALEPYAILPGGEVTAVKQPPREFVLGGTITGTSLSNLHANRRALERVLNPRMPGHQSIVLQYTGAPLDQTWGGSPLREIRCYYVSGLDGNIDARQAGINAIEKVQVRFVAADPNVYDGRDYGWALDVNDSATMKLVMGRLRSTGQWSALGPPAAPGTAGYNDVRAIAQGPDGKIYIGGTFTNWDNVADQDNIVVYDPVSGLYQDVGGGLNGQVLVLSFGPDGYLYAGGGVHRRGRRRGRRWHCSD